MPSLIFNFNYTKGCLLPFILWPVLILSSLNTLGQVDSLEIKARSILNMARDFHFQAPLNDSVFSQRLYDELMQSLDQDGQFFTQKDLNQVLPYQAIAARNAQARQSLVQTLSEVYRLRLQALESLLEAESQKPLDFSIQEQYRIETDDILEETEWKEHWRKYYKMRVLWALYNHQDTAAQSFNPDPETKLHWQKYIGESMVCRLRNDLDHYEALDRYIQEQYLKALAKALDPHSAYFSSSARQGFQNSLSQNELSYGIELFRNADGEIEVAYVVPGSPAWQSGKVNEGDIILGLSSEASDEDALACLGTAEVRALIESADESETKFQLRKQSGEKLEVELTKDYIAVEENHVESFVLEGERKIGYIYLPSFYVGDEFAESVQGCAVDVSNALIRLKRQGVEALIMDLRDNGGGAMYEALRLAGIFVDYGALSIYSDGEEHQTLKDMDRGVIYDQPMVILQNAFSASASELFAAALQDRNRAIIVGQASYGKSTVQEIVPLFQYHENSDTTLIPGSFIKLSTAAFYRVTGASHQAKGIQPDIPLPALYNYDAYREKAYSNYLRIDSIKKKTYYFPEAELPLTDLRKGSAQRIQTDSLWHWEANQDLTIDTENTIPLDLAGFVDYMEGDEIAKESETSHWEPAFKIHSLKYLLNYRLANEEEGLSIKAAISEDLYIRESFFILNDYLEIKSTQ